MRRFALKHQRIFRVFSNKNGIPRLPSKRHDFAIKKHNSAKRKLVRQNNAEMPSSSTKLNNHISRPRNSRHRSHAAVSGQLEFKREGGAS